MRFPAVALFSGILLAGALIAGCGGGGGGGSSSIMPPGRSTNANTTVQVRLTIPQKMTNGRRKPAYISPSTQSALVYVVGPLSTASPLPSSSPTIPPVLGVGYANFAPTSSTCTPAPTGLSCTVNIATSITAAGNYGILVATTDQPQTSGSCIMVTPPPTPLPSPLPTPCAGNVLAEGETIASVTPGSTTPVSITLGGIPIFVQPLELLSGLVGGTNAGTLTVFGPGAGQVSFELLDADKNVIFGLGSISLSVSSTSPIVTASISPAGPTGAYTLSLTPATHPAGGQNVVTPGAASLTFAPSFTSNLGPVTGPPFTLPVVVMHSVIYVAKSGGLIDAYLDGNNSTPAYTVYGSCASQLGLAVDPVDESLWAADQCMSTPSMLNNEVVNWPVGAPGAAPSESSIFCGSGGTQSGNTCNPATNGSFKLPQYLAFDASGDLFMSNGDGLTYASTVMEFLAPAPGQTPNAAAPPTTTISAGGSTYFCHLALDNQGFLYVGSTTPEIEQIPVGMTSGTLLNNTDVNGIAWGPDATLWYLDQTAGSIVRVKTSAPTTPLGPSITGIASSPNQSIAVDMLGNVYLADGVHNGVTEYNAASSYAPQTIGNSTAATYVVVYPDGLYGANHQVNVPHPGQSPIPIESPFPIP